MAMQDVSAEHVIRGSSGSVALLRSPSLNENTHDMAPAPVTNVETVRMLTQNISQIADTSPLQHRRYSVPSTLGTGRSLALAVFEQGIERPSHRVRCMNNIKRLFVPPKQNTRMWLTRR
ncbi:MAG: hypothetical protein KVP17_002659 [Porospora cf. gigantea B]|uniref:uncharacterized protein n=1 Tax=Porospora cf. gigantea B TaxID=2853592 RepID=UPI003571DEEE|nr:MAG: hypothetical protein KVP17_002659 [Porospora cf. gigantea B]